MCVSPPVLHGTCVRGKCAPGASVWLECVTSVIQFPAHSRLNGVQFEMFFGGAHSDPELFVIALAMTTSIDKKCHT